MSASRPPEYVDLLAWLEATRSAGVSLGLERTRAVLDRLGNPQRRFITVHIAGTNGKGSTAAMTESILRAAGLRTGLYTSPHLSRFTERIRVNGREAPGDGLAALAPRIMATGIPLTYFELATVLGFLFFAEVEDHEGAGGVEVAVVETGLGGRLDATTTCEPVATAITSIALDHAELLGATLPEIAREKAGIAKPAVPLFLGPLPAPADLEIAVIAARVGAPLSRVGRDFDLPPGSLVGLPGAHQRTNAALAVALAGAAVAAARPASALTPGEIAAGLGSVSWPGRMEKLQWQAEDSHSIDLLFDCAHNSEGAAALARALDVGEQTGAGLDAVEHRQHGNNVAGKGPRALVFSVVAGKPADEMLAILAPRFDAIFITQSSNPRSLSSDLLRQLLAGQLSAPVFAIADPFAALTAARAWVLDQHGAGDGDGANRGNESANRLIVIAGSTFLVGDLRAAVLGETRDPIPTSDPVSLLNP